jgi:carbamoyltransferase
VTVAGGVFANVKFNQRIHELAEVENIFIHPAMDDGGLCVGSALAGLAEQPDVDSKKLIRPLTHVYLGNNYSDLEIESVVNASDYQARYLPDIHTAVAQLLAKGQVVARFTGAMEFGPRALGHRSILYQTTDVSVNDWLNTKLKRTEFMPFAPATLEEFASGRYVDIDGAANPARFMTVTFNCTELMKQESPGIVHIDGTARPQLVDAKTAPDLYKILWAYYQLTGIPSLINTSFNMHGEPIVCSPADAMRSFEAGNLDYLAIGNWLVTHPSLTSVNRTTEIFQQA